jgi:hypothetical protein
MEEDFMISTFCLELATRKDPANINFYLNWFCLVVSCVLPMALLVIVKVRIYLKNGLTGKNRAGQVV